MTKTKKGGLLVNFSTYCVVFVIANEIRSVTILFLEWPQHFVRVTSQVNIWTQAPLDKFHLLFSGGAGKMGHLLSSRGSFKCLCYTLSGNHSCDLFWPAVLGTRLVWDWLMSWRSWSVKTAWRNGRVSPAVTFRRRDWPNLWPSRGRPPRL